MIYFGGHSRGPGARDFFPIHQQFGRAHSTDNLPAHAATRRYRIRLKGHAIPWNSMQLGMIGLGRMGANMVRRLTKGGQSCVVFDLSAANVKQLADEGATGSSSLADFVAKLDAPRAIWMMVPAAAVDSM